MDDAAPQPPERPQRPTADDPWGHQVGEDPDHILDATGHLRRAPAAEFTVEPVRAPRRARWWRRRRT